MSFQMSRRTSAQTKIEWIVPNLVIRNDVNLIDGRKATGKSSVIAAILGDWHNTPQEVNWHKLKNILWLSSEEHFDIIIKPRLMQYGITADQVMTINYRTGESRRPILPIDRDALGSFIREHKINALVIDPFSELKPADYTINDNDQMRAYMTALVTLCDQVECTAFVPRHNRKSSGTYAGDDGMGSVGIKAAVRHALRIDITEEKVKRRFLFRNESNLGKDVKPLQFDFIEQDQPFGKLVWKGHQDISVEEVKKLAAEKPQRMKLEEAKRLLIAALADGPKPAKQLIEEADNNGIGERTLCEAKANMPIEAQRRIDTETGKAHWVWVMLFSKGDDTHTTPGEAMPQLTLTDLPESTLPPDAKLPDAAPAPKRTRKPRPKPDTTPAPKPDTTPAPKPRPKGKGRGPNAGK